MILGGYWSTYWYEGRIYGTEIVRGLDVLALVPSEYLSANEIAAATLADQGEVFNPQQQFPVTWPAEPVVARAYLDQLARDDALDGDTMTAVSQSLDRAEERLGSGARDRGLAKELERSAKRLDKRPRRRQLSPNARHGLLKRWPVSPRGCAEFSRGALRRSCGRGARFGGPRCRAIPRISRRLRVDASGLSSIPA